MPRLPLRGAGAPAALGLALLAGCAGPGTASSSSAAPPSSAAARACEAVAGDADWHGMLRVEGDQVTLDAHDDYFSPSCLVVPTGRAVTVVLTDRGHLPHTLVAGDGAAVSASVDAGGTTFVTLPALQRPTRFVCSLHEDEQMVLAVVPAAPGGDDV